jgi:hypothetical protein
MRSTNSVSNAMLKLLEITGTTDWFQRGTIDTDAHGNPVLLLVTNRCCNDTEMDRIPPTVDGFPCIYRL